MNFLDEEFKPVASGSLPLVEFATPKVRQNRSDSISTTASAWDRYQKRKEIVEELRIDYRAILAAKQQDGYVSRAINKYVNSIFLRNYKNYTLKPAIERYLRIRLHMIVDAMPDHNHIDDFFQSIARDLVAYANVYLLKIRRPQNYKPGGIKIEGVPHLKPNGTRESQDPIVAYELVHPATMHIIRDTAGNIIRYEQWPLEESTKNQRPTDKKLIKNFDRNQVIHIVDDRESGFPYGNPFLSSVIDDVRLLRTLEDHVSRLAFRFAFPFTQVKVGETKPGFEASEEDLEYYKKLVRDAPPDATLVTSEKVSFDVVGAQGHAIQLEPYLEHFEERAFTGLGVSGVSMGRGDTANRATADAMSTEMHDQIKHFQNVISRNISEEIYRELLLEGGYDWYADPDKNWCLLVFNEIEVESQIKREAHQLALLQANAITFEEFRVATGRQPFKEKDWDDTYLYAFLAPQDFIKKSGHMELPDHKKMIEDQHKADMKISDATHKNLQKDLEVKDHQMEMSKQEAEGKKAEAGAHQVVTTGTSVKRGADGSRSVATTKSVKTPVTAPKGHFAGDGTRGPAKKPTTTAKGTDNKNRPANQHGKRSGPKRKTEGEVYEGRQEVNLSRRVNQFEGELSVLFMELKAAAIEQANVFAANVNDQTQPHMVKLLFELTKGRLTSMCARYLTPSFYQGIQTLEKELDLSASSNLWLSERNSLSEFNERTVQRLITDLVRPVIRITKKANEGDDLTSAIDEIFEKVAYRVSFIAHTEVPQAFWFGYASAAHTYKIELDLVREDEACEQCANIPSEWKNSSSARKRLMMSPTLHPNCSCGLTPHGSQEEDTSEG